MLLNEIQKLNIKMQNYNPKLKNFTFLIIILVFTFLFLVWLLQRDSGTANALDAFAKCLADKGITMYGAEWCSHCKNEKNRFGPAFRFVPYVECPDEPDRCIALGIKGYPTWIFPDGYSPTGLPVKGRKLEGEQGLEKLSIESGCPIGQKVELHKEL